MKIITRYLAREVYTAMLATIVVLLCIFLSNQFVRYMHYAAGGNLSSHVVKIILLLQIPILSAVLLPVSLFLAILLAYGRLYADSEMTVLTSCGISPLRLLSVTFRFSIVVMVVVAILSLWINPRVYKYYDRLTSGAVVAMALEMVKPNSFNKIANGKWIFYVDKVLPDKRHYLNIFAAEQPDLNNPAANSNLGVIVAKSAYQKIDPDNGDVYMVLSDGYRYSGTPGKRDFEMIKYDEYGVKIKQNEGVWQSDESSESLRQLWRDRDDRLAAAELHWRVALPLSALVLTLLGAPLSRISPRSGRYGRIIPGIILYIIYVNFLFLAKAWLKKGVLTPELGMWWVHGIMLFIAVFLICGQVGWRNLGVRRK